MPSTSASDPRTKAVIIAWDMSHNAVGRAYLLADMLSRDYDVLVIGPIFARFGTTVWPPVAASSNVEHRAFRAESLHDFATSAVDFVREVAADVVIACKPRLPSILLALLLKHRLGCPILLDVDDHELSFFQDAAPISLQDARAAITVDQHAAEHAYGELWTRVAEALVASFDTITVSNLALQRRFGGTVIRHARDEHLFRPEPRSRAEIRAEFGYSDEDKVVLFLGTPREHKGIFRIADAFRRLRNEDLALCVVGTVTAKSVARQLASYGDVRIDVFPDEPWSRLPELIRLADCVCLLQDEANPVSQYQIPAKLTDALATAVPVAVTEVPPFADIPRGIVTIVRTEEDLDAFLLDVSSGSIADHVMQRGREYFMRELSYAANRGRLSTLISRTRQHAPEWRKEWSEFLCLVSEVSGFPLPRAEPDWDGTTRTSHLRDGAD